MSALLGHQTVMLMRIVRTPKAHTPARVNLVLQGTERTVQVKSVTCWFFIFILAFVFLMPTFNVINETLCQIS